MWICTTSVLSRKNAGRAALLSYGAMGELCTSSLEYIIHPIKTRFIMKKAIFPFLLALLGFSAVYARDFRPGYVQTAYAHPDARIYVAIRGKHVPARVVK